MSLPTSSASKEMYHRILPHFILRQFNFDPSNNLGQDSWRTHDSPEGRVLVYDLTSGRLQPHSVPKEYSKLDVFKDVKNLTDVEYVESKLKDFEDEASSIVQAIHDGLQVGEVTLSRALLSTLRKFIFVAYYRGLAVHLYEAAKGPNSLLLEMDSWLQGLNYYLDTPHHEIVATGEMLREEYENSQLSAPYSYPDKQELNFQCAIEYEAFANNYVLGVWVAADEREFVLSGQAFSHWEGLISGLFYAHRIHVLTPRIAIILRKTCLCNPGYNQPSVLHSILADVPIFPPIVRYRKTGLVDILAANPAQAHLIISDYRATPEADQDSFRYSFTQLSPEQTFAINEVIMMNTNLRYRGSVIFRHPSAMRETLDLYMASPHTSLGGKRRLFYPLRIQLAEVESQWNSQVGSTSPREDDDRSTSGFSLRLVFNLMTKNDITFSSAYTRAIFTFHMMITSSSNPTSQKMYEIRDAAIDKLRSFLDPPLLLEGLQDSSNSRLVQSLAQEESVVFFSLITPFLEQADIVIPRSSDLSATVINEAAIIGVTHWLAEERPDVLRDVLLTQVHIWA